MRLRFLKKFEMEHYNAAITPAEPRLHLSKDEHEQDVNPTQYRRMIGSLRYLCNIRPNLVFSFGIVRRFIERPKVSHFAVVKRILRYVKGIVDYKILLATIENGKKSAIYSDILIPTDAKIKMIENLQLDISLYSEKHQSLGV